MQATLYGVVSGVANEFPSNIYNLQRLFVFEESKNMALSDPSLALPLSLRSHASRHMTGSDISAVLVLQPASAVTKTTLL